MSIIKNNDIAINSVAEAIQYYTPRKMLAQHKIREAAFVWHNLKENLTNEAKKEFDKHPIIFDVLCPSLFCDEKRVEFEEIKSKINMRYPEYVSTVLESACDLCNLYHAFIYDYFFVYVDDADKECELRELSIVESAKYTRTISK